MYGVGEGNAKAAWRKQHTRLPLTTGKHTGLISVLFAHQLNQMPQKLLTRSCQVKDMLEICILTCTSAG